MIPDRARRILWSVAEEFRLRPDQILSKSRNAWVVLARIEAAKRIAAIGPYYSTKRIGKILNKDHTTIVYYLGNGTRKPSMRGSKRSRRPVVRPKEPAKVEPEPERKPIVLIYYLQPYAGADPREYKWKERRREDHPPP